MGNGFALFFTPGFGSLNRDECLLYVCLHVGLTGKVRTVMNIPTKNERRLVIVGATGMVGGYALRYALEHPAVARVRAIGRRTLGISHPKLDEVIHRDFAG